MPAKRTHEIDDSASIRIKPQKESSHVFFTDEDYRFQTIFENTSNKLISGKITVVAENESTVGPESQSMVEILMDFEVPAEDYRCKQFELYGVGLQGHGSVGIRPITLNEKETEFIIEEKTANRSYIPLFSTMIWDRDFYRVNYIRPRRAQYLSVVFALLSVVFAGMVVWLSITG